MDWEIGYKSRFVRISSNQLLCCKHYKKNVRDTSSAHKPYCRYSFSLSFHEDTFHFKTYVTWWYTIYRVNTVISELRSNMIIGQKNWQKLLIWTAEAFGPTLIHTLPKKCYAPPKRHMTWTTNNFTRPHKTLEYLWPPKKTHTQTRNPPPPHQQKIKHLHPSSILPSSQFFFCNNW